MLLCLTLTGHVKVLSVIPAYPFFPLFMASVAAMISSNHHIFAHVTVPAWKEQTSFPFPSHPIF